MFFLGHSVDTIPVAYDIPMFLPDHVKIWLLSV